MRLFSFAKMALSRFEYVKKFELSDELLRGCWIVVRIDGKAFHKFSDTHQFVKPNDKRALDLMNHSARIVMKVSSIGPRGLGISFVVVVLIFLSD